MARDRLRDFDVLERAAIKHRVQGDVGAGGRQRVGSAGGDVSGVSGVAAQVPPGLAAAPPDEHMILRGSDLTIADGGEAATGQVVLAAPVERVGFPELSSLPTTTIPISVAGMAGVQVTAQYESYRAGGDVQVIRTRYGVDSDPFVLPGARLSPITSRWFAPEQMIGVPVRPGDTLKVILPNSSGGPVTLEEFEVECKVWASRPITTPPDPDPLELLVAGDSAVATNGGSIGLSCSNPANTADGDLLVALLTFAAFTTGTMGTWSASGWTLLDSVAQADSGGGETGIAVMYRYFSTGDSASTAFGRSGGGSGSQQANTYCVTGGGVPTVEIASAESTSVQVGPFDASSPSEGLLLYIGIAADNAVTYDAGLTSIPSGVGRQAEWDGLSPVAASTLTTGSTDALAYAAVAIPTVVG